MIAPDQRIEYAVHSSLRQVPAELSQQRAFLGPVGSYLFRLGTRQFLTDSREPQTALVQDLRSEALLLAQQSEQQMLGANVLVIEPLGFLSAVGEHAFTLVAQREID